MEIVRIFGENLFAFKYSGESYDEFRRIFNSWADPEYLEDFFENNKSDLINGYYDIHTVEGAIFETYDHAVYLENRLLLLSEQSSSEQLKGLEEIFKPLHNSQTKILQLNKCKAQQNWLRLYALRVDKNVYIITGGTIKLTRTMQERAHTMQELDKISQCREFLLSKGIVRVESLIEETEI
jgi:hypothetical protein